MYSIEDLSKAQEELDYWNNRFANDSSNNPNKHRSQIKSARAEVRLITDYLKSNGTIALTEKEVLEKTLDNEFPNAKSNEIVEFNGVKYKRKFFPLEKSNSRKTVTEWGKKWEQLK